MRKCYLCNGEVMWKTDYSFEDFGYEGEGIVHRYVCRKCGAEIEVSEKTEWKNNIADSADG